MKKLLAILLAAVMVVAMAACGSNSSSSTPAETSGSASESATTPAAAKIKVVNLVNGNLGDKSFFDSAEAGMKALADAGIVEYKTIEMGPDEATWQNYVEEVASSKEYDIIVCGTWQMPAYLKPVAEAYPDQKFVLYDTELTKDDGSYYPNVACIQYKQNDMGYLMGTFAGLMEKSDLTGLNDKNIIGFVGGVDSPVIWDFLIGYIEGAQSVNADVKIDFRWINSYTDTAAGKELGAAMIQDGADIVWGVGGDAGSAAVEACKDAGVWFLGVDSDQEQTLAAEYAAITLTSGLKKVGDSLQRVITAYSEGDESYFGKNTWLGLGENGVGIVTDKNFAKYASKDIQDQVNAVSTKILSGEIKVDSAFDETFDYRALGDSVKSGS